MLAYKAKVRLCNLLVCSLGSGLRILMRRGMETLALGTVGRSRPSEKPARRSLKDLLLAAEARTDALVPDREGHHHRTEPALD